MYNQLHTCKSFISVSRLQTQIWLLQNFVIFTNSTESPSHAGPVSGKTICVVSK